MSTNDPIISFTVYGEPASKANSRQIVMIGKLPAVIKSKKARDYVKSFQEQCPRLDPLLTEDVSVTILVLYLFNMLREDLIWMSLLFWMQCRVKNSYIKMIVK